MTEEQRNAELEGDESSENNSQDDSSGGSSHNTVPIDQYKHLQAAYTQTSQEIGSLKEKLSSIESQRQSDKETPESDALAFLESEEVQEELDADPSSVTKHLKKALKIASEQLEQDLVQTLQVRDDYYHQKFMAQDPEYKESAEKIKELRNEDPAFSQMSDEQLLAIVKRSGEKPNKSKSDFRGNPGSGKPASKSGGSSKDIRNTELYQKIYGGK